MDPWALTGTNNLSKQIMHLEYSKVRVQLLYIKMEKNLQYFYADLPVK